MTEEELIKTIEIAKAAAEWEKPLDWQIAFDMAIKALEKQEKYRWHHRPESGWTKETLPEVGEKVLLEIGGDDSLYAGIEWTELNNGLLLNCNKLICPYTAWMYIPPVEEGAK